MSDIALSTDSQEAIGLIISIGIPALTALLFLALTAFGARHLIAQIQETAAKIRPAVDEPTDPVIMLVERVGEALLRRDVDPESITKLLTAVSDHLAKPPQEVNIGGEATK